MKKGKSIGKISAIALVGLMIGAMLGGLVGAGGIGNTNYVCAASLTVPSFKQCDWGANQLGTCCDATICSAGCAITSVAMILRYYGVNTDPGDLNTWLKNNSGYDIDPTDSCGGSCLIKWDIAANRSDGSVQWAGKYTTDPYDWGTYTTDLPAQVKWEIDHGYPCVGGLDGHFVVITGYSDSSYYVNDPSSDSSTISQSSITKIYTYHGTPQLSGRSGGPDSFGYTFLDSNTPNGPTYDWVEISSTGTEILSSSDDSYTDLINTVFFFNYYGTDYTQLRVANNGLLFEVAPTSQYVNELITQTLGVHGFIAPFWDDIVTWGSAGSLYYQILGEEPNRKFVVEWKDNQHYYSSTSGITFEAILYEGSNNILFQYQDVAFGTVSGSTSSDLPPYDNGGSATVGIEGPTGDVGLQYSFNEEVITPGLAILFKFPQFAGTNLYLSKQAPANKDRGSTMTYTLYYHNFGDTAAQNVVLEDTLPAEVEFVSASDGGSYDLGSGKVTWNIGSVAPSGHGGITTTVRIGQGVPVGTVIQNHASISTSNLEVRYDDNEAHAQTRVTGSNLPPDVGVEPNNGGTTPSVYWHTPITFSYQNPTATSVDIRIHMDDGGPDITGSMVGGPPDWTYITTFYPRHGAATVTYTVNDPTPYFPDFDVQNMRGFENTITAAEIVDYIRETYPTSPMLAETDIGDRFINAGLNNHVNPAFLIATAQHEGNFGTGGWAASHPNAHNTMGWGIYPGHMEEDWEGNNRNAFESWGDGIEHVAWRIAADNGNYYGQGRYTVSDIREVYAGDPAIPTIINYMNDLAESAGQAGEFDEDFNIYIDPAGSVYDTDTDERIAGANVWLQRPDGTGGWENVPTGELPAVMQPDVNPLVTDVNGQYQWDVLEGSYRVHVEAAGYYSADSVVVSIPPPVTDLHVGLTRILLPPVANADGPYSGYVGSPITFNGTGSHDVDGTIVSYEWDLDYDGEFDDATGPMPSKTWDTAYSGNISLRVTDTDGLQDIDSAIITVEVLPNQAPIADAGLDPTICAAPPTTSAIVIVDGSGSYDMDGDPLTYNWTWNGNSAYGSNATIELPLGTTTVTLVVNDGKVDSEPDGVNITVSSRPAAVGSSNSPVPRGGTIELHGGPSGMASYNWTGPDGWTNSLPNPTRPNATAAMAGTYYLVVTNEHGCTSDPAAINVQVRAPAPPGGGGGGGGGGSPTIKYLTVDWEGNISQEPLYSNDRLKEDLLAPCPDSCHSLLLETGTHAPTVDGKTHYLITVRKLEGIPPLPDDTAAIVAIEVTPTGAVLDRDTILTLGFDQLPENAVNATMAYYDDVGEVWIPLESEAGGGNSAAELTLSATINHFSIFGVLVELEPTPPPQPAHFAASGLNIEPTVEKISAFVTKTGAGVIITADIGNDGGERGTYTVELKLNGETVDTATVTLGGGQSQQVSFTRSGLHYGQHDVEVAGLSGDFTTSRTITWWLITVIIVGLGLIIWGVAWGTRRRKAHKAA